MQFRGNYTLTFHTQGLVTQAMLPEPPKHCPITLDEAIALPDQAVVAILKRAICNRALHMAHDTMLVMGDDVLVIPCASWHRNNDMIQFLLETHLDLLLHPDIFPASEQGTERHGL